MRIDIENKILIPFMILIILSISAVTAVSYYNGYELILNSDINNLSEDLDEMILFIEKSDEKTKNDAAGKYILDYYRNSEKNNLVIFTDGEVLLNNYNNENKWVEDIMQKSISSEQKIISTKDYVFAFVKYDKYNWVLGYRLNKNNYINEVLSKEKNIILIAIITLIFSMEAAILISYNISKPIKRLAEHCDKIIDQDSFQDKIEIKRNDEIGTLSDAYNNMLFRLKNNTEKIIEMKNLNEEILQSIPSGIITTDQLGHMLAVNEAAKDILHYKTNDNLDIEIIENLLMQSRSTLADQKIINAVLTFNDSEGNIINLDVTTSLLKSDDGLKQGVICSFNDITERKKFENSMDMLDRLTTIGQFAAGIAHEIRNPLTGMRTSIQVLRNRLCKTENETNEKLFDGVIHEIDRINNLIGGLLNFAKPKVPNFEKTDLIEVLDRALELVRKAAKESNIVINVIDECKNKIIFSDKAQIEQIFLNIIKNAMNAIGAEGEINIVFKNYADEEGSFVEIEFHDCGCGIPAGNINKIFNPFFTTSSKGTGLGLTVVYELLKGNNGKIDIHSTINEGTKVKIKFPIYGGGENEEKNINC